jgi:hypothetical protein
MPTSERKLLQFPADRDVVADDHLSDADDGVVDGQGDEPVEASLQLLRFQLLRRSKPVAAHPSRASCLRSRSRCSSRGRFGYVKPVPSFRAHRAAPSRGNFPCFPLRSRSTVPREVAFSICATSPSSLGTSRGQGPRNAKPQRLSPMEKRYGGSETERRPRESSTRQISFDLRRYHHCGICGLGR